jgi:hypothetical protein
MTTKKQLVLAYFNPMFGSRETIREAMTYAYRIANGTRNPVLAKKAIHIVHNTFLARVAVDPSDDLITPDPKHEVCETMRDALIKGYALANKSKDQYYIMTAMHVMLNSCARYVYPEIEKDEKFEGVLFFSTR